MSCGTNYIYINHGWSIFSVSSSIYFWWKRGIFHLDWTIWVSPIMPSFIPLFSPGISFPLFLQNNPYSTLNSEFRHHSEKHSLVPPLLHTPIMEYRSVSPHMAHCSINNCPPVSLTPLPKLVFLLLEGKVPTVFIIVFLMPDT